MEINTFGRTTTVDFVPFGKSTQPHDLSRIGLVLGVLATKTFCIAIELTIKSYKID